MTEMNYFREAEILSQYLIGQLPAEKEKMLYADAMQKLDISFSHAEEKQWRFLMKNKLLIPFIDSALAVKNPSSSIRRKIFIMLAILEASPNYTEYFLPKKHSPIYMVKIFFVGIRAITRRILGLFLLKLI
jgi:hypothetical protein